MLAVHTLLERASQSRPFPLLPVVLVLVGTLPAYATVQLSKAAAEAFYHYTTLTEARMQAALPPGGFLWLDGQPETKAKVRKGQRIILARATQDHGRDIEVPNGLIQDWLGTIFMPNATLAKVRAVMQDYPDYKRMFAPEIIESKLLKHEGDRYEVFLRLYKKQLLTVVLNTRYEIRYSAPDSRRLAVASRSTRINEVKDVKPPYADEYAEGEDTGFLWRLNSYWRFEEADGGVYAECEAISLSRDVPFGLGWMVGKFVEKFPKESMQSTLKSVQRAVEAR